ncbi:hypothetical protein JW911_00890 [Candidatus Peregrinibacteria bacterium]|nr:hypothetical protein [Candidatus Peregrinibacteria bacterium]
MACFSAPAAAAVITTALRKKIPAKYHIEWLNALLWGGVIGLAVEHIAHQEIVPYFPYLTAMSSPEETSVMINEILTIGVGMLIVCVAVWIILIMINAALKAGFKKTLANN